MSKVITIIVLIIGVMIMGAGFYYLNKEKDSESKKIYKVAIIIGAVIALVSIIRLFVA